MNCSWKSKTYFDGLVGSGTAANCAYWKMRDFARNCCRRIAFSSSMRLRSSCSSRISLSNLLRLESSFIWKKMALVLIENLFKKIKEKIANSLKTYHFINLTRIKLLRIKMSWLLTLASKNSLAPTTPTLSTSTSVNLANCPSPESASNSPARALR